MDKGSSSLLVTTSPDSLLLLYPYRNSMVLGIYRLSKNKVYLNSTNLKRKKKKERGYGLSIFNLEKIDHPQRMNTTLLFCIGTIGDPPLVITLQFII